MLLISKSSKQPSLTRRAHQKYLKFRLACLYLGRFSFGSSKCCHDVDVLLLLALDADDLALDLEVIVPIVGISELPFHCSIAAQCVVAS